MAKGLAYALAFCETHLNETIDFNNGLLKEIVGCLREFEEFVDERMEIISPSIPNNVIIRVCPECSVDALTFADDDRLYCHFCHYEANARELAESRTELDIEICPECEHQTLALVLYNNDEGGWECCGCGTTFDTLERCDSCGDLHTGEGNICKNCMSAMMEKD